MIQPPVVVADDALFNSLMAIELPDLRQQLVAKVRDAHRSLQDGERTVLLLAARRMPVVYLVLLAAGLAQPSRGQILSDRFALLGPPDWLDGERILLLDDTRVEGRTLEIRRDNLARHLRRAEVATDWAIDLHEHPSERKNLHAQFARVFARANVPYYSDFPISAPLILTNEALATFLSLPDWLTFEVTNAGIADSESRSYSLVPDVAFLQDLENLPRSVLQAFRSFHLRLFCKSRPDGTHVCRLVPVITLNELSVDRVPSLARALGLPTPPTIESQAQLGSLVAYLVAQTIFMALLPHLHSLAPEGPPISLDSSFAQILLGPHLFAKNQDQQASLGAALEEPHETSRMPRANANASLLRMSGHTSEVPSFVALGDDIGGPIDDLIQQFTGRGKHGEPSTYLSLEEVVLKTDSNDATGLLAMDALSDLGRAVTTIRVDGSRLRELTRCGETRDQLDPCPLGGRLLAIPRTLGVTWDAAGTHISQLIGD